MDDDAVLAQVLELLQREKRLSYRVLKRRLGVDDDELEDLKEDLIYAKKLAVDEEGRVLVWAGASTAEPPTISPGRAPAQAPLTYTPAHLTEKILASRTALEGERKQVTVLFAEAITWGEDGVRIAETVDHPVSLASAYAAAGRVSLRQGDFPKAIPILERGLRVCQDTPLPMFFPGWPRP